MQPEAEQTTYNYQPQPETVEPAIADETPISWQASEYIQHDKAGGWFLALLGVAAVLLLVDIFLVKSWTFGALIVVMTIGVFVLARRSPRTLNYTLSSQSLQIDDKHFSMHDFRAFGVLQEDAIYSVQLIPIKRFMPAVNVYFPPEYGEKIVDIFGSVLPMEHLEPDFIDRLTRKIRF